MTDPNDPKIKKPNIHWTISKGEPPEPKPQETDGTDDDLQKISETGEANSANAEIPSVEDTMIPEEKTADGTENGKENAEQSPEEPPRRKSLRERNIIRLLELGDEAVQMRDYRMARKYYNEAKEIFGSRDAILRLKELDKIRLDYIRSLINSGKVEGRRIRRGEGKSRQGRRERDSADGKEGRKPSFRREGFKKEGRPFGDRPKFDRPRREDKPFRKDGDKRTGRDSKPGRKPFGGRPGGRFGKPGRKFGGKPGGRPFGKKPFGRKSEGGNH